MSDRLNTDERAELLAGLTLTTGMVSQLLRMLTDVLNAAESGRVPTAVRPEHPWPGRAVYR